MMGTSRVEKETKMMHFLSHLTHDEPAAGIAPLMSKIQNPLKHAIAIEGKPMEHRFLFD